MSRSTCTRLFARVLHRTPAYSRSHRDFLLTSRVRSFSQSQSLYSTTTAGTTSHGGSGYIKKIVLASAVGLAVTLAIYNARHARSFGSSGKPDSSSSLQTNYASPEDLQLAIEELRNTFPDHHVVETNPETLRIYGNSENSYHPASPHSVVVRMHSTEDVVKVVNISRKYMVPLTAYSGATSLEGHFSGVRGLSNFQGGVLKDRSLVSFREYLFRYVRHGQNSPYQW